MVIGLLLFFIVLSVPIKSKAAPLPSYSTDENGEIVVDGEFSEDGEKITYDEPVAVEEFEETSEVGEDGEGIDDCNLLDENVEAVTFPTSESLADVQASSSEILVSDAAPVAVYASDLRTISSVFKPENCLVYPITYNGDACTLLIPASYYESIYIDDNGVIWNVGNSTVQGRIIFSDTIDDSDYDMYLVQIVSCIGSTSAPSTAYTGKSLTEVRHYYVGGYDRLQYTSSYGAITANGDISNLSRNPVAVNKLMFTIVIALILGGGFLCYRRR